MAEPEVAVAAAASPDLSPASAEPVAPSAITAEVPSSDPAPAAAEEAAPVATEEGAPAAEDPAPAVETAEDATEAAEETHKRKLEDLEQPGDGALEEKQDDPIPHPANETPAAAEPGEAGPEPVETLPTAAADAAAPAKRQRLDGETDGSAITGDQEIENSEAPEATNGQPPARSADSEQHVPVEKVQAPIASLTHQQEDSQSIMTSRKFEVPNNKVGVLIGKAGETIKVLQQSSGAKIQITRDKEADPNSTSRPVELTGTLENINKAEQLIKDVIAEAEAGGSPALVARGFVNGQSGTEQHEIQVPNEKVGWIIGKGGETIKNLQTRSGARIQLIPQHLPDGDTPKERIVRVTGNKKQIEVAKEMIKDVMIQAPLKHASHSGGYNQQSFRPRGPSSHSQWGTRPPTPTQTAAGYDYQQRGMYQPQSTQYPSQPPYGSYNQQVPPRSISSTVWDQRAPAPVQTGGYSNYYGQGSQAADNQSIPAATPSPAPVNYNYGPSQAAVYGQQTPYSQSAPNQQNYGQGFNEQKYDNQAPAQQYYGQQPMNSQPGAYQQQGSAQTDYAQQQPYSKPAFEGAPQSYGPPRASQPGDPMYQGGVPSSYGSGGPTQQSYPYGQSAPTQQAPPYGQAYGPTPGATDGYTQPSSAATGYPQQISQVTPGYAQGGQTAPAYTQQGVQSGGYGQYPQQQSYADQSAPNNVNYGHQGGPAEAGYTGNNIPNSGYGSAPVTNQAGYGQTGYPQPQAYPSGYEQSMQPQPGYGSHPGSAPAGYTKGLSPQPGYGGQYYSG